MSRKKLIITAIILALVLIIGGIVAYFTDTDTATNTFTLGSIDIEVVEENWNENNAKNIVPLQSITKDPKIENKGKSSAYVFAEVVVPYVNATLEGETEASDIDLFEYEVKTGWVQVGSAVKKEADKTNTYIYAYVGTTNTDTMEALAASASTPTLFDSIKMKNVHESTPESSTIQNSTKVVDVKGYGIQSEGLNVTAPADVWALVK